MKCILKSKHTTTGVGI